MANTGAQGSALGGAATGAAAGSQAGPWGAVIGAGVGLVGGLLSNKGQQEAARRAKVLEGLQLQMQAKQQAARDLTAGTQAGIDQMMGGYGQALR